MNTTPTTRRFFRRVCVTRFSLLIGVIGLASGARAQVIPVAGQHDVTSTSIIGDCVFTSTLDPLFPAKADASLSGALGLAPRDPGFASWNTVFKDLSGTIQVHDYYAWTKQLGQVSCGAQKAGPYGPGKIGGAVFCAEYNPGNGDPLGADVFWVQLIRTNSTLPDRLGLSYSTDPATSEKVMFDNRDGSTPYYNSSGGAADSINFLDTPYDTCQENGGLCDYHVHTTFELYLASFIDPLPNQDEPTLVLYRQGVQWGYDFDCSELVIAAVPEPSTLYTSAALVCGILLTTVRRRMTFRKAAPVVTLPQLSD